MNRFILMSSISAKYKCIFIRLLWIIWSMSKLWFQFTAQTLWEVLPLLSKFINPLQIVLIKFQQELLYQILRGMSLEFKTFISFSFSFYLTFILKLGWIILLAIFLNIDKIVKRKIITWWPRFNPHLCQVKITFEYNL